MTTPAQLAGRICTTAENDERDRVRAILRRGQELGVSPMARELALETGVSVELAFRLLAKAAGGPVDDERRH